MNKLRWGLLSTARINQALLPPLRASARNELTAVASRDLERAQAYANEWDIPRVFSSYEAMLADPDRSVLKIDYDLEENPSLTVRRVLDELVQIDDNLYLGKAHVRWWWNRWQTVAYFSLVRV